MGSENGGHEGGNRGNQDGDNDYGGFDRAGDDPYAIGGGSAPEESPGRGGGGCWHVAAPVAGVVIATLVVATIRRR